MNKQITGVTNILVIGVALAVGVLAQGVQAAEPHDGVPVKNVAYQDLDLNTQAGVQVLYKRIQVAAKQVCGKVEGRDLRGVQAHDACVERAVSDAVGAVSNRMVIQAVAQVR